MSHNHSHKGRHSHKNLGRRDNLTKFNPQGLKPIYDDWLYVRAKARALQTHYQTWAGASLSGVFARVQSAFQQGADVGGVCRFLGEGERAMAAHLASGAQEGSDGGAG